MRTPQEKFKRPELFLSELIRKFAKGQLLDTTSNSQPFFRAVVLAVDTVGGRLSNPAGSGAVTVSGRSFPAIVGPSNPQNSIKARVITKGFDRFFGDDETRVFWPMVQNDHLSIPMKAGEHVYVMFEDEHFEHGLWLFKVAGHEGQNVVKGAQTFSSEDGKSLNELFDGAEQRPNVTDAVAGDVVERQDLDGLF